MKKFLSLLFAGAILLSFAACGDKPKENGSYGDDKPNKVEEKIDLGNPQVGDYVTFGKYEQDNNTENGKEAVEWLVLDKQDGRILVISKYILDNKSYNEVWTPLTWEECSIRNWLNNDFLNTAFTDKEKEKIPETSVLPHANPYYDYVDVGNETSDRVFILSITEVEGYFDSDSARECKPTEYAIFKEAELSNRPGYEGNSPWWLRSPGHEEIRAACVNPEGDLNCDGYAVDTKFGIRPAMWIEL